MENAMKRAKKIIYSANNLALGVVMVMLMMMMFFTVGDVTGRYFGRPIQGTFEMTRYCLAVIVFLSLGYSQINKVHIAIEIFYDRLPVILQRIIDIFIYATATIMFALVFRNMLAYGGRLFVSKQFTTVLRVPVYPFVYAAAVGVLLFDLVLFTDFADAVHKLVKGGDEK